MAVSGDDEKSSVGEPRYLPRPNSGLSLISGFLGYMSSVPMSYIYRLSLSHII